MSGRGSDSGESSRVGVDSPLLGPENGISKDRRRFIVLAIFDFALLLLLWLICTVSNAGDDLPSAFINEINIFDAHFLRNSLFDIVIVVSLRMLVLIVCYGVLRFAHWSPVALTTATTSLFLLIKVLFFFSHRQTPAGLPQYMLVMSAFIVAWVELWFMPFKVLPRERVAEAAAGSAPPPSAASMTRPIITFSDDDFRSALEFTTDSEEEEQQPRGVSTPLSIRRTQKKSKALYIKAIEEAEREVARLLNEVDGWRALRSSEPVVRQSDSGVFYVKAHFKCSTKVLFDSVWKNNLDWNDQVLDAKEVLKVDSSTALFYSVSAPAMRGYIASRDFLDVRRAVEDNANQVYAGYFVSVDSHLLPPNANKRIIRGTNGPSIMRVHPVPAGADSGSDLATGPESTSCLEWLMQSQLNGGLPRRIVQASMLSFFVNNMARLKQYIDRIQAASIP